METFIIDTDIPVFCVTASSFPAGILQAHQSLHALVPFSTDRKYFGISRPEDGAILYKAAATELTAGELSKHGLEAFAIKKGQYIGTNIQNYMQDIPAIGKAFEELIQREDIDPQGYCIEWYLTDKDVRCMVRLKD